MKPVLVIGYGNPSRGDDAVGPLFIERLDELREQGELADVFETLTDFQLQIEHATDLQQRSLVLFADASLAEGAPYVFQSLTAERDDHYSTHAMSPASVLAVYQEIYHAPPPPAYLLGIRGHAFELGEPLSEDSRQNLAAATTFACQLLADPQAGAWTRLTTASNA